MIKQKHLKILNEEAQKYGARCIFAKDIDTGKVVYLLIDNKTEKPLYKSTKFDDIASFIDVLKMDKVFKNDKIIRGRIDD